MPIDQPDAPAVPTTRRTFLARTAIGGAVVTAGSLTGGFGRLLPVAGAPEPAEAGDLSDADLAAWVTPLELGAVIAYQTAGDNPAVQETWGETFAQFKANHQEAADVMGAMIGEGDPPKADPRIVSGAVAAVSDAGDLAAVQKALAGLEDALAATYLDALADIKDPVSAKQAAQIMSTASQQAAILTVAAGGDVASATPPVATTDGAIAPSDEN